MFLGHYCLRASVSLVCCLNIVVKLWNSCIFKWLSRLVNKPWMLYRLDFKTSKRRCEHRAHTSFKQCVFEIGKEMSIEGCYCGLSFSCEPIDHAMSGIALPERMKRRISFSDTWTTKQLYNKNVECVCLFSDNLLLSKEIAARLMCELYMVHFLSVVDMNGNVNEKALGQYRVDFLVGAVQTSLTVLSGF